MLPDRLEGIALTHVVILAQSADFSLILAPGLPTIGAASTWGHPGPFVPWGAASRKSGSLTVATSLPPHPRQ